MAWSVMMETASKSDASTRRSFGKGPENDAFHRRWPPRPFQWLGTVLTEEAYWASIPVMWLNHHSFKKKKSS
jgi:hypothetical protein